MKDFFEPPDDCQRDHHYPLAQQPTREGNELIASIVQANVDGLARTTDAIIANKDMEIASLKQELRGIVAALTKIPHTVMTVQVDRILSRYEYVLGWTDTDISAE